MTSIRDLRGPARTELPETALARWASIFFSLSVLTFLISLTAAQAFLGASGVLYVLHVLRARPPIQFPPIKLPLVLFCLLTVVSIPGAENPAAGWLAVRKLVLLLILLLAVNLVTSARNLEFLYQALFVEAALAGVVAAAQFALQYRAVRAQHPERIYFYMTVERIHGFMGHWMNFGGQQMLVFSALLAYLFLAPKPKKIWWLALAIIAGSIVLNFTRGVWLGCLVATLYVVGRWKPRGLWALPVLLLAGYLAAPSLVGRRLEVLRHPSSDASLAIRFEMWHVAWRMIRAHPWVGVGPNNVEEVYLLYLPRGESAIVGYHEHLHNNFLQFAAERGLPCLTAWLWLMGALAWQFWRIRRRPAGPNRETSPTWVEDAALAAWLAMVVEGCFEFNFGASPVLMVFLFVVAMPFAIDRIHTRRLSGKGRTR